MAAIGFAIANIPPIIEITPIPILIPLYAPEICLDAAPTMILPMPVITKAIPKNITNIRVVTSGFEITKADSPIAIAPKIISAIRIPFGVFSTINL